MRFLLLGLLALVACGSTPPAPAAVSESAHPGANASAPADTSGPTPSGLPIADPVRLRIPSIAVDAAVVALGLDSHGDLSVPKDPVSTAWFTDSARPGEPGNAVVNGHVDWYSGDSVFGRLRELKAGDEVTVVTASGTNVRFLVNGQRLYAADAHPAEVFARGGPAMLRLVTCGGPFNLVSRRYEDRLVVTAMLAGSSG